MIDEAKKLLSLNWDEEKQLLIKKFLDNLIYYKKLIPKSLCLDVKEMIEMATNIKIDYDNLIECHSKCTCKDSFE